MSRLAMAGLILVPVLLFGVLLPLAIAWGQP
jgi:hypothetical protein